MLASTMEGRFRALLLLLSLSLLLGAHGSLRTLQVSIHPMKPPITQPFDPNLALNSPDLPSTDTRVVKKAAGCEQPEQVCITTATYISNVVRRSGVPETHTGISFSTLSRHPVTLLMSPPLVALVPHGLNSIFAIPFHHHNRHLLVLLDACMLSVLLY